MKWDYDTRCSVPFGNASHRARQTIDLVVKFDYLWKRWDDSDGRALRLSEKKKRLSSMNTLSGMHWCVLIDKFSDGCHWRVSLSLARLDSSFFSFCACPERHGRRTVLPSIRQLMEFQYVQIDWIDLLYSVEYNLSATIGIRKKIRAHTRFDCLQFDLSPIAGGSLD